MAEAMTGLRQLERWAKSVDNIGAALRLAWAEQDRAGAMGKRLEELGAEICAVEAQRAQVAEALASEQATATAETQTLMAETQTLLRSVVDARERAQADHDQLAAGTAAARLVADDEIMALRKATEQELASRAAAYAEQAHVQSDAIAAIEGQVTALKTQKAHLLAEIADLRRRVGAL